MKLQIQVEADVNEWGVDVLSLIAKYPILEKAIAVVSLNGKRVNGSSVEAVSQLIDRVNPRFPGDSFSVSTLANLVSDVVISPEEIDIIEKAVPVFGEQKIRITKNDSACSIDFSQLHKKSSMRFTLSISGGKDFGYPYTVEFTTFQDMDEMCNHWLWNNPIDEDSQQCCEQGDCNCEAEVAFSGSLTIEDNFDAEKVLEWAETHLYDNQRSDKEKDE